LDTCGQSVISNSRLDYSEDIGINIVNSETCYIKKTSIQAIKKQAILANPQTGGETILSIEDCFFERNGEASIDDGVEIRSNFDITYIKGCFSTDPKKDNGIAYYSSKNMSIFNTTTRYGSGRTGIKCEGKLTAINCRSDSSVFASSYGAGSTIIACDTDFGGSDINTHILSPIIVGNKTGYSGQKNKYRKETSLVRQFATKNTTATIRVYITGGDNNNPFCNFKLYCSSSHPTYTSTQNVFCTNFDYASGSDTISSVDLYGNITPSIDDSNLSDGYIDISFTVANTSTSTSVKCHALAEISGSGWDSFEFLTQ